MKSLFFFCLILLGVYSRSTLSWSPSISFDSTKELNSTKYFYTWANNSRYRVWDINIYQVFKNYTQYDGYNYSINWVTPNITDDKNSFSGVYDSTSFSLIWEPCRRISEYNFTIYQEVTNSSSQLIVDWNMDCTAADTLIDAFPITDFIKPAKSASSLDIYRTLKMDKERIWVSPNTEVTFSGDTSFYENKDLLIMLSADSGYLSSYINEVIFATGDECIWSYNQTSENRFVKEVPSGVKNWNITVPAREMWFLDFRMKSINEVRVDYFVVERLEVVEPSSSFILRVDFNLMVVLIVYIFNIFQNKP